MGFSTVQNVREVGNLPDESKLPSSRVLPHLKAAFRELEKWIGTYSSFTGDDKENVIEAECSLCMAFALPTLNTFFTEGVSTTQKEVGDMEFQFINPDDVDKTAKAWIERAKRAVSAYNYETGQKPISFIAI